MQTLKNLLDIIDVVTGDRDSTRSRDGSDRGYGCAADPTAAVDEKRALELYAIPLCQMSSISRVQHQRINAVVV